MNDGAKRRLDGNCFESALVYKADYLARNRCNEDKYYNGSTEGIFKTKFNDHNTSRYRTKTKLSGFIWALQDKEQNYEIKWSVLKKSTAYQNGSRRCNLCLTEKLCILEGDKEKMINKRDELMNSCPHRKKYFLKNYKDRDERR